MSFRIKEISITKMLGSKNITIPIKGNKLILVGENGSGKSTFINIFFYFITFQWEKLITYEFESLSVKINNRKLSLSKDDLKNYLVVDKSSYHSRFYRANYEREKRKLRKSDDSHQLSLFGYMSDQEIISNDLNISFSEAEKQLPAIYKKHKAASKKISSIMKYLDNTRKEKLLFLPTYRRIEHELKDILPKIHKSIKRYENKYDAGTKSYIEFVRFGMEDVKKIINSKMKELNDHFLLLLNNMSGRYLGDVIKPDTISFTGKTREWINKIDETIIDELVSRIDNKILPKRDKLAFKRHIFSIKDKIRLTKHDKIVLQYLFNLLNIYVKQTEKEVRLAKFINICNGYFSDKYFYYDNSNFKLDLRPKKPFNDNSSIELDTLSSGEKQVVSIFSHVYLSDKTTFLILIDEPELSLSVQWQKKFLLDIKNSKACKGIISATHSPFIFDNKLEKYAHSIEEFQDNQS